MMIQRFGKDQRGVAALTVLLVVAVLAVAGGAVIFLATSELEIGSRDRRAEDAFAASEAGLDLAAAHLFEQPTFAVGQTEECLNNPLVDDAAGIACEVKLTSPSDGQFVYPPTGKPFIEYTVASEAQQGKEVTRTLAATYRLNVLDLPYGMFINGNVDLNGNPTLITESMLVNGTITSRNKLLTDANTNGLFDDPDLGWRFHEGMITSDPALDMCLHPDGTMVGCAAAYSNFQIFAKNSTKNSDEIHFNSPDPALSVFPRDRDVHQTKLDGSGAPIPVVDVPTSSVLEVMPPLKSVAERQGLYLDYKNGTSENIIIQPNDLNTDTRNFEKNVVVYIDADADDEIGWKVDLIPDDPASDIKYLNSSGQRVGSLSGVIVVRGGDLRMESGLQFSGALFVPEGEFRILGNVVCTCTTYSNGFTAQGGGSTIRLTPEWFNRLPAGFMKVVRTGFYECEPFQASAVCP